MYRGSCRPFLSSYPRLSSPRRRRAKARPRLSNARPSRACLRPGALTGTTASTTWPSGAAGIWVQRAQASTPGQIQTHLIHLKLRQLLQRPLFRHRSRSRCKRCKRCRGKLQTCSRRSLRQPRRCRTSNYRFATTRTPRISPRAGPISPRLQDVSSGVAPSADLSGPEPSGLRSSYADNSADEEAPPQIPVTWPVVEAVSAPPDSSVFAPPSAFLVGGAAMALVFMAGWAFRHIRARRIYIVPSCAEAVSGHSPQGNKADTIGSGGASARRAVARRRPTPTDPARDLKASLGELMRDLQRAGAAAEAPTSPIGKPKRRIAAAQKVRLMEVVD